MGRSTLKYELKQKALNGLHSTKTVDTYKTGCEQFADYCKAQGIKSLSDVNREVIQAYEADMHSRGLSPSTIHTRLAPVCKAAGLKLSEISKPRRTADQVTRSRTSWKNEQGIRQRESGQYDRVVTAQESIGCRRSELAHLKIENIVRFDHGQPVDWVRDESGHICVEITSGKGGKYQLQRVLPDHVSQLRDVVQSCKGAPDPHTKLFTSAEMANKLDLHGIRGEVARDAYDYYLARIQSDPSYRDQLKNELIQRYDRFNNATRKGAQAHRDRFVRELTNPAPYNLRGTNKEIAMANARPVTYDRVALMATSVFHLSHWRNDVTITSYMLGR